MKIFILGVNGFIGNEIVKKILDSTNWYVTGIDIHEYRLGAQLANSRFSFKKGSVVSEKGWMEQQIISSDVVIPLAGIATPASYVKDPIGVFESVFEENLWIIKRCFEHKKRVIFPSTSEVYGMCPDVSFNEKQSHFVQGPIEKERWIYSCSKQLLDRLIWAYGKEGLPFTIFRPFNWIGCTQDSLEASRLGSARVIPQFIGQLFRYKPLKLVDGGEQKRSFTDIRDGINALMQIIENRNNCADGKIFNIGNPSNNFSIKELADTLIEALKKYPESYDMACKAKVISVTKEEHYGKGYQDVYQRVPDISEITRSLNWRPEIGFEQSVADIVAYYVDEMRSKSLKY